MSRMSFLFVLCLCFGASDDSGKEENPAPSDATVADAFRIAREQEKCVLASLSKPVTLSLNEMSLSEVLEQLSKLIDREILINVEELGDEGISIDQTVALDLGEVAASQLLYFTLMPINLAWVAHDGILEITTQTHADKIRVTRVYDVRHLCKLLDPLTKELPKRQLWRRPQLPPQVRGNGTFFSIPVSSIAEGMVGQLADEESSGKRFPEVADDETDVQIVGGIAITRIPIEEYLASILVPCSSLKWQQIDGEGGTIQTGQGRLVVSQSYQGQFEIAGILQALEQLLETKTPGQLITAQRTGYPHKEDAAIFEALRRPMTLEIPEGKLSQVLGIIAREAGFRLWIDQAALSDEGISCERELSPRRRMQKLPLGIFLKKILEPDHLTWVVNEGVLIITTETHADEQLTTRFYDISWISLMSTPALANGDRYSKMLLAMSDATHGKWINRDNDGGTALFISSKHLAIRQSQKVHAEIALLFEDLMRDANDAPVESQLDMRIYAAPDLETARDLIQTLPNTLKQFWDQQGSMNLAGRSLLINQTTETHELIALIMDELVRTRLSAKPNAIPAENSPVAAPSGLNDQSK